MGRKKTHSPNKAIETKGRNRPAEVESREGSIERTSGEEIRTAPLVRSMRLEVQGDLEREDTAENEEALELEFPVSSEFEVRRDWPFEGLEILDHRPSSIRLERFKDGAAVVAGDHYAGALVGATSDAWVGDDSRLWVRARFASIAEAKRERTLIREGIRRNVSIRYRIHSLERSRGSQGAPDVYRATDWEPVHVALVNDPEDPTVGFGREASETIATRVVDLRNNSESEEIRTMTEHTENGGDDKVDRRKIETDVMEKEAERRREILSLGRQFNETDLAIEALERGLSIAQFKDKLLERTKPGKPVEVTDQDPHNVGLSEREVRRYSFFRALRYLEDKSNPRLAKEAGLEIEASKAIEGATGDEARGLFIPTDVLKDQGYLPHRDRVRQMLLGRADMGATLADTGQKLVGTDHLGASFIDVLRNASAIMPRATILSGLQGNIEIPKKTVSTAGTWVTAEGNDTAADDITIGQVTMSAKDVGAHVIARRRLLIQGSPDVENMIRTDLAVAIALAIDAAAINGTGTGVPTGFLNNGSIGDWSLVSDPPATHAADPQYSDVLALWKLVAQGNALFGDLGWLMGANHAAHFLGRSVDDGSGRMIMQDLRTLLGYPVVLSEQCPADTVAFLNFRQIVIGMWGGLDMLVDPYSASKSASVVIRAIQTADTVVRQEAGIAAWQDSSLT